MSSYQVIIIPYLNKGSTVDATVFENKSIDSFYAYTHQPFLEFQA